MEKLQDRIPIDLNLLFPIFSLQEAIQLRQQHENENEDLILKLQDQKQEMQQKVGTSKVFVLQWSTWLRQMIIPSIKDNYWLTNQVFLDDIQLVISFIETDSSLGCNAKGLKFLSMDMKGH